MVSSTNSYVYGQSSPCKCCLPASNSTTSETIARRSQPPTLATLPSELLVEILLQLDWRSLKRCTSVSPLFNTLITNTPSLVYEHELGADGLVDGLRFSGSLPTHARLAHLRERRNRWASLMPVDQTTVPVPGECTSYELVGGVFAKAMHTPLGPDIDRRTEHQHLPFDSNRRRRGPRTLTLTSLPSSTPGAERSMLTRMYELDVPIRDFALDPAQDLIAIVELPVTPDERNLSSPTNELHVAIHLRSLSAPYATHPLAESPILRARLDGADSYQRDSDSESGEGEGAQGLATEAASVYSVVTDYGSDSGSDDDAEALPFEDNGGVGAGLIPIVNPVPAGPVAGGGGGGNAIVNPLGEPHLGDGNDLANNIPAAPFLIWNAGPEGGGWMAQAIHPNQVEVDGPHILRDAEGAVVQIAGDVLALFVLVRGSPRLVIWQWTTGKILVHETSPDTFRNADDFTLLSPRAFMTTVRRPRGCLQLYSFSMPPVSSSPGDKYKQRWRVSRSRGCIHLLLPELTAGTYYAEFTAHSAPCTSVPTSPSSYTSPLKPFYTSEDSRVHVLTIATAPVTAGRNGPHAPGQVGSFIVVVPNRLLLEHIEQMDAYAETSLSDYLAESGGRGLGKGVARRFRERPNVTVPWESWGPRNTRWLAERHTYAWLRYVHGARFVKAVNGAWPATRCRMQVLDFGVRPGRPGEEDPFASSNITIASEECLRAVAVSEGQEVGDEMPDDRGPLAAMHRFVSGNSVIHEPAIFVRDVESSLPYRELTTKEEFPYSGFMIDDERIIGLSAMAFASGDMKKIDVFTF